MTALRTLVLAALLAGCAEEDRDIEIRSYGGLFRVSAPLPSRLGLNTLTLVRAAEVVRDERGELEEVIDGCVDGESNAPEIVQVVSLAGACDQFGLIARTAGTAVLTFRTRTTEREVSVLVGPWR